MISRYVHKKVLIGALMFLGIVSATLVVQSAFARPNVFDTGEHIGFFTKRSDPYGGRVFDEGINASHSSSYDVNDFVRDVRRALNGQAPKDAPQDKIGAAFIILTMLDYKQGASNINTPSEAISRAEARFDAWERLVRDYDAARLVNYNANFTYRENTYWQGSGEGSNPNDVAWYTPSEGTQTDRAIVFRSQDNNEVLYAIKHDCANPVGDMSPLEPTQEWVVRGVTRVDAPGVNPLNAYPGEDVDKNTITVTSGTTVTFTYLINNRQRTNIGTQDIEWVVFDPSGSPDRQIGNWRNSGTYKAAQLRQVGEESRVLSGPIGTKICRYIKHRPTAWNDNSSADSGTACAVIGSERLTSIRCGGSGKPTTDLEADAPFTISPVITYSGGPPSRPDYRLEVRVSGGKYANADQPYVAGARSLRASGVQLALSRGVYTVTWRLNGPDASQTSPLCTDTISVVQKPYFRVYGGDVQAGSAFASQACAPSTNVFRGIGGFYDLDRKAGAGTSIAAFAATAIDEFATTNYGSARAPKGLTFANTGRDDYGGDFVSQPCIPDYWSAATAVQPDRYVQKGITINAGGENNVYVDGDAFIDGNIAYGSQGTWSINTIPKSRMIVRGNIYISSSVTDLAGFYVALPRVSGGGGVIYTCADAANKFSLPTESFVLNSCANRLVVTGGFAAKQVKLLRTAGSLKDAGASDASSAASSGAEVFRFSPEVWLTTPAPTGSVRLKYDSITSLPPIL